MASQTLTAVNDKWPDGTSVSAYALNGVGERTGSAVATAAVTSGNLTFTGLADATHYQAFAAGIGVFFSTPTPSASGGPSGPAGGALGGTYPNPSFASDMATQAELDAKTVGHGRSKDGTNTAVHVPGTDITSASTQALAAATLRYEPFLVQGNSIVVDALFCEVTTASGTVGAAAHLGIYAATFDWQPTGAPLADVTVACDSTGVKLPTFTPVTLPPGRYVFATLADNSATLRAFVSAVGPGLGYNPAGGSTGFVRTLTVAQAYGALPSSPPAGTFAFGAAGFIRLVMLRATGAA